jgi:hypothetical protein
MSKDITTRSENPFFFFVIVRFVFFSEDNRTNGAFFILINPSSNKNKDKKSNRCDELLDDFQINIEEK